MNKLIIVFIGLVIFLGGCTMYQAPFSELRNKPRPPAEIDFDNEMTMVMPKPRIPSELDGPIPLDIIYGDRYKD